MIHVIAVNCNRTVQLLESNFKTRSRCIPQETYFHIKKLLRLQIKWFWVIELKIYMVQRFHRIPSKKSIVHYSYNGGRVQCTLLFVVCYYKSELKNNTKICLEVPVTRKIGVNGIQHPILQTQLSTDSFGIRASLMRERTGFCWQYVQNCNIEHCGSRQ